MIIPLGAERAHGRRPIITLALIAINVLAYVAMTASARSQGLPAAEGAEPILERWAFETALTHEWWRFLTYTLLHDPTGFLHLAGNMLFLWVFGPNVEDRLGHIGFSVLYIAGATVAAWAHSLATPAPVIGASGAVAAVTGAFMVLYPRLPIRVLLFFVLVGVYFIPALWFIAFAIARDFLMLGADTGVSNAGHIGGYALGFSACLLLLATGLLKREPQYDLLSIFKHRQRLREFKAASQLAQQREQKVLSANAKSSRAKPEPANPDSELIATARADVAAHLSRSDLPGACRAYREMLQKFPSGGTAIILSRHNQLAIANALFQSGDHATALPAYRHFLAMYPRDQQAPHVHLMLGLIRTRYLRDETEARKEIEAALVGLRDADQEALARDLLRELGPADPSRSAV